MTTYIVEINDESEAGSAARIKTALDEMLVEHGEAHDAEVNVFLYNDQSLARCPGCAMPHTDLLRHIKVVRPDGVTWKCGHVTGLLAAGHPTKTMHRYEVVILTEDDHWHGQGGAVADIVQGALEDDVGEDTNITVDAWYRGR